jgi:hypothetical protein
MATKIVSATPTGRVRRTTAIKKPTDSRIKELISLLGIDEAEYKWKAGIRKYTRMASNPMLA